MNYIEAIKLLEENNLSKAVFLYGEEEYLADFLIEVIKDKYLNDSNIVFNHDKIDMDSGSFSTIQEAAETLPFMAEKRVIEVRGLDLSRSGISKKKDFFKDLEAYLDQIGQGSIVLIVSSSGSFFKGSLYKKAEKYAHLVKLDRLNHKDLYNFIGKRLASEGLKINARVLNLLIGALGYETKDQDLNLYDVNSQLDKIISRAKGKVTEEDLSVLNKLEDSGNIFNLTDAISHSNTSLAIENFLLLNKEEDNYQTLYMIIRHFRNILNIKILLNQGKTHNEIKSLVGIKDYEFRKLLAFEKKYTVYDLKTIFKKLYTTDLKLKSGKGDFEDNMVSLIVSLSGQIKRLP